MITKKAEYTIQILAELAYQIKKNQKITSKQIAERQNVPQNLVIQLISNLREVDWVESIRGPSGGIKLVRDENSITLKDVIELIDGPIAITRCLISDFTCKNREGCHLKGVWHKAQQKMVDELEKVTIKDLADAKGNE